MGHLPDAVPMLERELRGIFGSRLRSFVVYGLRGHGGQPTRTMALVDALTEQDLRACAGRVASWHDAGLATPLVIAAREWNRSLDAFPLEFGAIIADHVVVSGASPFDGASVDRADIRRACEVQARSHLLHLREGFLEAAGNRHALALLIEQSAAPLAALLTSVARLDGGADGDPAAAARHAERLLGVSGGTIADVVQLADHEISAADAEKVFPAYLAAVERLVDYIDSWRAK